MTTAASNAAVPGRRARTRSGPSALLLLLLLAFPPASLAAEQSSTASAELGERPILSAGALEYRPGRGLRLGSTGLVIGGFTNVKAETTEEAGGEFALDLLNFFFIFDRFSRFRAVAELQLKDIFVADEERAGAQDFAFDVRRLFGDFTVADALRLRTGTFLTPVGYWNLILAPPLTWTTEAPLIVEETFFQPTTTGVMLHGSTGLSSGQLGYSLFSQFLDPLEDDPDLNPPRHTTGLRLEYTIGPAWSVGASYQAAESAGTLSEPSESDDESSPDSAPGGGWSHLGGLHFLWQHERGEILGEWLYQDGEALRSAQWGTYLQGVIEVYRPFYLVGRYEHFDPPSPEPALNLFSVGGVWKPFPFMAFKVEYRFADRTLEEDNPRGFFSSFTTFF